MERTTPAGSSFAAAFRPGRSVSFRARMCPAGMGWSDSAAYSSCMVWPLRPLKSMVIWLTRKLMLAMRPKPQLLWRQYVSGCKAASASALRGVSLPDSTAFWSSASIRGIQHKRPSRPKRTKSGNSSEAAGEHQFRTPLFQTVLHTVERLADQVQPQPARFDLVQGPALHPCRVGALAEIAQAEPDARGKVLAGKRVEPRLFMIISVPDDVAARFVQAQHDEVPFGRGELALVEKRAHEAPHQAKIARVAGEFDLAFPGARGHGETQDRIRQPPGQSLPGAELRARE